MAWMSLGRLQVIERHIYYFVLNYLTYFNLNLCGTLPGKLRLFRIIVHMDAKKIMFVHIETWRSS